MDVCIRVTTSHPTTKLWGSTRDISTFYLSNCWKFDLAILAILTAPVTGPTM